MIKTLIERCGELKLQAFTSNLEEALAYAKDKNWSPEQVLLHLMNLELERRRQSRVNLRFKQSKLNEKATIDQFNFAYHKSRKNQKSTILNLIHPEFIS